MYEIIGYAINILIIINAKMTTNLAENQIQLKIKGYILIGEKRIWIPTMFSKYSRQAIVQSQIFTFSSSLAFTMK